MLQDAGFNMAFKPIRVKFKPSAKDVQVCEESGVDLAQAVHKAVRAQERQAGSSQVKTGLSQFHRGLRASIFNPAGRIQPSQNRLAMFNYTNPLVAYLPCCQCPRV